MVSEFEKWVSVDVDISSGWISSARGALENACKADVGAEEGAQLYERGV